MFAREGHFLIVNNCRFISNKAGVNGGALYIWGVKNSAIKNSIFEKNLAGLNGGGTYVRSVTKVENQYFEMKENEFKNNKADLEGGGVAVKGEIIGRCHFCVTSIWNRVTS